MTAQVEILVNKLDNVLSVPVQAVVSYDGKDHLAVKKPGGDFEWRDVVLGISNEKHVEIKDGLKSGESVILGPVSSMSEEEKREKFGAPIRPTPPAGSRAATKTAAPKR